MRSKAGVRIGHATLVHEQARGLAHVEMAREAELSMPSHRRLTRRGGGCVPGIGIGHTALAHELTRGLAHVGMAREAELSVARRVRLAGRLDGRSPGIGIGHAALVQVQKLPRSLAHVEMAREAELSMPSRRVVGRAGPSCRQEEAQCHEGCNKVCSHGRSFPCDAQRSRFFSMMISTRRFFWRPSGSSAPRGVALGATGRFAP
jgi:hypothetical protein